MRILITGSEGVLGSTLKAKLRSQGHQVYGCDLQHTHDPNVTRADVAEFRQVDRLFTEVRPDMTFHFAAEFGRKNGQDYYEQLWKTNCIGTRNVIEACVKTNSKMVFASSSEAYGTAEYAQGFHVGTCTRSDRKLEERDLDLYPPQFHNEYALTKWTNEHQVTMAARNQNLCATILRFFNVYGPPEKYSPYRSVVCLFAYRLLEGLPITVYKNSYRTHLWIGDWANTVSSLADPMHVINFSKSWAGSGGTPYVPVFNIGGKGKESTEHMLELLQQITGIKGNITRIEEENSNVASKEPDNFLAEEWLGHEPTKDFAEGLRETVWFLKETYGF